MATFQKRGSAWRAIIRRQGASVSATFDTKAEAQAWATAAEAKIIAGASVRQSRIAATTVAELFERYAEEVSPTKRGERWEVIRLGALSNADYFPVFQKAAGRFTPEDMACWRDERLKVVSPASVNRELNLISAVFTVAIKEWRIPIAENPVHLIRRPKQPPSRKRRVSDSEVSAIARALGWDRRSTPELAKQWSAFAFELAVETAMRRGEILGVTWGNVHLDRNYLHLPAQITKTVEDRDVPLSPRAVELLRIACGDGADDDSPVVPVNPGSLDTLFRKAVRGAGIRDLHFHDSRHEATTRLSRRLSNVLELAAVTGHKTLKMLQIYYNPSAADLAAKLA